MKCPLCNKIQVTHSFVKTYSVLCLINEKVILFVRCAFFNTHLSRDLKPVWGRVDGEGGRGVSEKKLNKSATKSNQRQKQTHQNFRLGRQFHFGSSKIRQKITAVAATTSEKLPPRWGQSFCSAGFNNRTRLASKRSF